MLGLYAASVLLFEDGMMVWLLSQAPVALLLANLTVAMRPLGIFIGGAWAVRSAHADSPDFQAERPTE